MRRGERARLVRDVPVQLLDFSWSGCLVAASQEIEPGTTGTLRINMGGMEYLDTVRIVRRIRTCDPRLRRPICALSPRFVASNRLSMTVISAVSVDCPSPPLCSERRSTRAVSGRSAITDRNRW